MDYLGFLEVTMRFNMIAVGALFCVAGCAGMATRDPLVPGLYQLSQRVDLIPDPMEGRVRIISNDSIQVLDTAPVCVQVPRQNTLPRFAFTCGFYSIVADATAGPWKLTYQTSRTVESPTTSCLGYGDANGKRTCTSPYTERHETNVPVAGVLVLTLIDMAKASPPARVP